MTRRVLLCAVLAACSAPPPAGPPDGTRLAGTEWVLVELGGRPVPARPQATLAFEDSAVGGFSGCNWFGGPAAIGADTIRTAELSMTMIGCPEPVAGQESRFLGAVREARRFRVLGDTLVLAGGSGELRLRRRRLAQMDPAALQGTRWRLARLDDRAAPGRMTLSFSRDSIAGQGGCRDYTGSYTATGHRLRVTSIAMADTECGREAMLRPEGDFTTGLSETTDFQVRGDTLVLHTVTGGTLVFSREDG